ncbi:MAG: hypothetical protein ACWA5U_02955 [bacterium]
MKKKLAIVTLMTTLSLATSSYAESQKLILDMHEQGYTLISAKGIKDRNTPHDYRTKLSQLVNSGQRILDVDITPDGGWSIITQRRHYYKNIPDNYQKAIHNLQQKGIKINSIAFYPNQWQKKQGYVIIYDRGYKANNAPSSLTTKLDEYLAITAKLKNIEFTPNGGWSILTDTTTWSQVQENASVKLSYLDYMRRLYRGKHEVFATAFNPIDYNQHFGWVIVEDKHYAGQYMPEALKRDLNTLGYTEKIELLDRTANNNSEDNSRELNANTESNKNNLIIN